MGFNRGDILDLTIVSRMGLLILEVTSRELEWLPWLKAWTIVSKLGCERACVDIMIEVLGVVRPAEVLVVLHVFVLFCLRHLRLLGFLATGVEHFAVTVHLCELKVLTIEGKQVYIVVLVVRALFSNLVVWIQRDAIVLPTYFLAALRRLFPPLASFKTDVLFIVDLELAFIGNAATIDTDESLPAHRIVHDIRVELLLH